MQRATTYHPTTVHYSILADPNHSSADPTHTRLAALLIIKTSFQDGESRLLW